MQKMCTLYKVDTKFTAARVAEEAVCTIDHRTVAGVLMAISLEVCDLYNDKSKPDSSTARA